MLTFSYTAKQGPHKIVRGEISAESAAGAIRQLNGQGMVPLEVVGVQPSARRERRRGARGPRVSEGDTVMLIRHWSDLLDHGLPVAAALAALQTQTRHPGVEALLTEMAAAVRDGASVSAAMEQHRDVFSEEMVQMARVGEMSGQLGAMMARLADVLEARHRLRQQVMMSLLYPAFIIVVGIATMSVLLVWVIPRMAGLFDDIGQSLPWPTVILMSVSDLCSRLWWVGALLVIAAGFYGRAVWRHGRHRLYWEGAVLGLPVIGRLLKSAVFERWSRMLGALLSGGVDVIAALQATAGSTGWRTAQDDMQQVIEDVRDGERLSAALKKGRFFFDLVVDFVTLGEESGELARGFEKLADFYKRQLDAVTRLVSTLLEPALILGLGLAVGFIVLALVLPVFRMNMMVQ